MVSVDRSQSNSDTPRRVGLRDLLPPWHRLRYLAWRVGFLGKRALVVRLVTGERLVLRPQPSTDLQTAMEIFFCEAYRSPRPLAPERVRKIVDLGSNVGYSVVYLSRRYPYATIEAYEPHPTHVQQALRHVTANGLEKRVKIHAAAAGNQSCRMYLLDAENQSTLFSLGGHGRIEVPVVDWLATAGSEPIDFLKMDIEGSEYGILFDPRFPQMNVRNLVVEWHETPDRPAGGEDVVELLQGLGYHVTYGFQSELQGLKFGLIWGYRD